MCWHMGIWVSYVPGGSGWVQWDGRVVVRVYLKRLGGGKKLERRLCSELESRV